MLLVALSMYNTVVSVTSLQGRHGLPFLNQVAGWMIFGVSLGPNYWSHAVCTPLRMLLLTIVVVCTQDSPRFSPFARSSSPPRLRGRPKGDYSRIFSRSVRALSCSPSAQRDFSTCRIVRLCIFGPWSRRMRVFWKRRNIERLWQRMTAGRKPDPGGTRGA